MDFSRAKIMSFFLAFVFIVVVLPLPMGHSTDTSPDQGTRSRRTIIVNQTGEGNYTHIQWAVDNATDGDTILIHPGIYFENIQIRKCISLIGMDRNKTIIDAGYLKDAISIGKNGVSIMNLTVTNTSYCDIGIDIGESDNCLIRNNFVYNNWYGILLGGYTENSCNNNVIDNNLISSNRGYGVYLSGTKNGNLIINNNISDNGRDGIYSTISDNRNLTVTNNTFSSNHNALMFRGGGFESHIHNNSFINDEIVLIQSNNNIIENNFFTSGSDGIYITMSKNNIVRNNVCLDMGYSGIHLDESYNNIFENNTIKMVNEYNEIITNEGISYKRTGFGNAIKILSSSNNIFKNNKMINGSLELDGKYTHNWNSNLIDISNTVNGKTVYLIKNKKKETIPPDAGQIILCECEDMVIENRTFDNISLGITIAYSTNITVENNDFRSPLYVFGNTNIYIYNSHDCTISKNIIRDSSYGISLLNSYDNQISENDFSNNSYGISLDYCENNLIENNICNNCHIGINIDYSEGNSILSNTLNNNSGEGINLYLSNENKITNNECRNNRKHGIYVGKSSRNIISDNQCSGNELDGIHLYTDWYDLCNDNEIISNICNNNSGDGIHLILSDKNTIARNSCINNSNHGIYVGRSLKNIISDNQCSSNKLDGIHLYNDETYFCEKNEIISNICNDNHGDGIHLILSEKNNIVRNSCNNNIGYGIYVDEDSPDNILRGNHYKTNGKKDIFLPQSYYDKINVIPWIGLTIIIFLVGIFLLKLRDFKRKRRR